MQNLRTQFPNMDALVAFEAAARLSSFALAGKELNVTASAISQQIKALEHTLGVALFTRGHRSVQLTQDGKEFSSSVSVALRHLSNAATDLTRGQTRQQITIAADTSIIAHWLMPRLKKLEQKFSDHSFRLYTSDIKQDLLSSDFQFAILHGRGNWQGFESRQLLKEKVYPVCSPAYASAHLDGEDLQQVAEADLLDLEYENWHWMNWTIWLTELGLPQPGRPRKIISNNYASLIDAAKNGMGLALAWHHFHDEDLRSGALVAPFSKSVKTQNGYHLVWPYNRPSSAVDQEIRNWFLGEHISSN